MNNTPSTPEVKGESISRPVIIPQRCSEILWNCEKKGQNFSAPLFAKEVYAYLKTNAVGRINAITTKNLAMAIWNRDSDNDLRLLRTITHWLSEQGLPIAFSPTKPFGIYIFQEESEKQEYLEVRRHYALSHLRAYSKAKHIKLDDSWYFEANNLKQSILFSTNTKF